MFDLRAQPRVGVAVQVGPELVICARLVAEDEAGARVAASALGELLRRVEMKVMQENHLDALVRLHNPLPPGKIGLAAQPNDESRNESSYGPNAGLTEVLIPAGYVQTVYDPYFVLSPDKMKYVAMSNNTPTTVPAPGLPWSLVFRAEPGKEDVILKVASAYQAASKRRVPPPMFKALPGEP